MFEKLNNLDEVCVHVNDNSYKGELFALEHCWVVLDGNTELCRFFTSNVNKIDGNHIYL